MNLEKQPQEPTIKQRIKLELDSYQDEIFKKYLLKHVCHINLSGEAIAMIKIFTDEIEKLNKRIEELENDKERRDNTFVK